MSKGVNKHCSILNYIRHADDKLYDLVQDLCIGRMFVPRKGVSGLTFLRPDKQLLEQIQALASGDDPEKAVDALQSMLLLDNLDDISDFEDKRNNIPTFKRKKLPVASVDGSKVVLSNGAEIHPDKEFESRGDRENISVYILSKALVPASSEPASASNASARSKSKKHGGGDTRGSRGELFGRVLAAYCASVDSNPAVELLVTLLKYLNANDPQCAALVRSQLSDDAIASLAVILQPYRTAGFTYISADVYNSWLSSPGVNKNPEMSLFVFTSGPLAYYTKQMELGKQECAAHVSQVLAAQEEALDGISRSNIVDKLAAFYSDKNLPHGRRGTLAYAEAELRVFSALAQQYGTCDIDRMRPLFCMQCTLDKPYICADKTLIKAADLGCYFSGVYLIARSDALFYLPGLGESAGFTSMNDVQKSTSMIKLGNGLRGNDSFYNDLPTM